MIHNVIATALVRENNKIEGILRDPTELEILAYFKFMALDMVKIADLIQFISVYEPFALLRLCEGRNCHVGDHAPSFGGERIPMHLQNILNAMEQEGPWQTHNDYENLHPFTDGNGRSGRMLWAWQMRNDEDALTRGFLHSFYYQTLSACRNVR